MRFSSIQLKNYRQYEDLTIEFEYGTHDLHVLIGDNGTGKTNLLNAFTWCLYGVEPHLGIDDVKRGEPRLAKEAIRKALRDGRSQAEIRVGIEIELEDEVDRITRSVSVLVRSRQDVIEKKPTERLVVQRMLASGKSSSLNAGDAENYIDKTLPIGIREYFFFDGEHLSNYFADMRGDAVKGPIRSIAQIDVITLMRDRTKNTVSDLNRQAGKEITGLPALQRTIDEESKKAQSAGRAIESYQDKIHRANIRIGELNEALRGIPDIEKLENQRDALKDAQKRNEDELKEAKRAFVTFARTSYIDFAFYEVVSATLDSIQKMEKDQQLPPAIDRSYLAEMLAEGVCKVCGRRLSEHDQTHLSELLEQFRVSSVTSHTLVGMRSELRRLKERVENYQQNRKAAMARLQRAQESADETDSALAEVNDQIVSYPNTDRIKEWYDERKGLEDQVRKCWERIGSKKRGKEMAEQDVEKAKRQQAALLNKANKQKDIAKAVAFGNRAVKILETVEQEVITEVRNRMSSRTEELFKELVWKDSKCDHITLDDNFQLSLYDRAGYSCEGTCSAAERALLALSFTLAMHEVSGFESPLFIDTPIARASGENRANFARILAEISTGKQLILTFTPDEYSEAISVVFDEIAATNQTLALDESEQKITIRSNNG